VATRLARPPDAQTVACPCRHGDVPAEIAGQRPLLERAAAGDREAFARLYDAQVEGVYRYLLAWTGDRGEAAELTAEVFHGALAWLPVTAAGEGEAGAWLIAMARDAVAQRRGSAWIAGRAADAGPGGAGTGPRAAVAALGRLGDPEREVAVLRLLLGHSLGHTAHLSGYSQRAVLELQLTACLAIWDLTGGAGSGGPAGPRRAVRAEEFERRLGRWEIDLTGSDPALAEALAVAGALRRAIPGYVVAPDDAFVQRLRAELLSAPAPGPLAAPGPAPGGPGTGGRAGPGAAPGPGVAPGPGAVGGAGPVWRSWLATAVAAAGTVVILALRAFGGDAPPPACGDRPCPPPTTVAAAAAGGLGTPLSTAGEPSTTRATVPSSVSATTAAASTATAAAPTTRPATTAPPTSRRPRPTTTRATTTTAAAPTTTAAAATTTTAAPAPP
jgi:DNA-directed RNA polymerase specialized sigma24 family protein